MGLLTRWGLEEQTLEIEKLHDLEMQAKASKASAVLYDETVDKSLKSDDQDEPEEQVVEQDQTNPEEPAAEESQDATQVAIEAWRQYVSVGTEEGSVAMEYAMDVLKFVGLTVTPWVLKNVYHGAIFTLSKVIEFSVNVSATLANFIKEHTNSYSSLKKDVLALKLDLKDMVEKPPSIEQLYTNQKIIDNLKIGVGVSFHKNLQIAHDFCKTVIEEIDALVDADDVVLRRMIDAESWLKHKEGGVALPDKLLEIDPSRFKSLKAGEVKGYETKTALCAQLVYPSALPGDLLFLAVVPASELKDFHEVKQAYAASKMIFAADQQNFREVDAAPYLSLQDLNTLVDTLEQTINLGLKHAEIYSKITKRKNTLYITIKSYAEQLLKSEKLSEGESLVEHIRIKQKFIDSVYIEAMMNVHFEIRKMLAAAISFAEKNIKYYQ